jgi:hypothetical protein
VRAIAEDDSDGSDEDAAPPATPEKAAPPAPGSQVEPGLGPRPLSPEDPIFHRALELLKSPVKKAA